MDESILTSIKKMLGIDESATHFDQDIIIHINSVFMILRQLGVGSNESFAITDSSSTWSDFLSDGDDLIAVQTYMYLRVRILFDPPSSSFVLEAMNKQIEELGWRLTVMREMIE